MTQMTQMTQWQTTEIDGQLLEIKYLADVAVACRSHQQMHAKMTKNSPVTRLTSQ